MGNSKQQGLAQKSSSSLKQGQVKAVKSSNGKKNDDPLVDEVKKLDQIRDMLFGEHVATLQNDYQRLGNSLDQNVSILRKELSASIEELKLQIDQKFTQLQKNLKSEEVDRIAQHEGLSSTLSSVNTDMLTKIDLEAKRIDQALNDQHQEATRELNNVAKRLQDAKVDRKSLANLFSQFAKELEGL